MDRRPTPDLPRPAALIRPSPGDLLSCLSLQGGRPQLDDLSASATQARDALVDEKEAEEDDCRAARAGQEDTAGRSGQGDAGQREGGAAGGGRRRGTRAQGGGDEQDAHDDHGVLPEAAKSDSLLRILINRAWLAAEIGAAVEPCAQSVMSRVRNR